MIDSKIFSVEDMTMPNGDPVLKAVDEQLIQLFYQVAGSTSKTKGALTIKVTLDGSAEGVTAFCSFAVSPPAEKAAGKAVFSDREGRPVVQVEQQTTLFDRGEKETEEDLC